MKMQEQVVESKPSEPSASRSNVEVVNISFVSTRPTDGVFVIELPAPVSRWGVATPCSAFDAAVSGSDDVQVMCMPVSEFQPSTEQLAQARYWVDSVLTPGQPSQLLTLQGVQIFWSPRRIACLAAAERLDMVLKAVLEPTCYESELRTLESTLAGVWSQLECDLPLAFEFNERSVPRRKQLQQRFQQVLMWRSRLARISPLVHCPYVYPPTLASQIGERIRERSRMESRYEFLDEQIEVFEQVYEMCGDRASNYMLTRSGNLLEWIIIVLLCAQLLLSAFEILTWSAAT